MISPWMGDRNTLQNGGSVVTLRFGGLFRRELDALGPCVPGTCTDRLVLERQWMSSGEEAPDTLRGLALSFRTKFPWVGGSVAISIWGTYTALLVSQLFQWCGRVSLMIRHFKPKREWSALGWVTATRYKSNMVKYIFYRICSVLFLYIRY